MPSYAGSIDDRAAILKHHRNFVAHRIENAPDVDVENATIFHFSSLIERAFPFDAGVVKCDVELAKFPDRKIDHRLHVCVFCDVSANERRVTPKFFDLRDDIGALRLNYFCAGTRELDSRRLANAGGSSGYQCNLTFK
jgi:hypothetical protein